MNRFLLIATLLLAGCVQLPPLPGDAAAKRFEAVPDRAVIYLVRDPSDRNFVPTIFLDGDMIGPTYRGTYMRLVVPGGRHRIAGFAGDNGQIDIQTEPGRIYFINQVTYGYDALSNSHFYPVDEKFGRSVVLRGTMTNEIIR